VRHSQNFSFGADSRFKEIIMVKRLGILLAVFVSLNAALFAEEDGKNSGRFFAGGGVNFTPASNGGGYGEFSFPLYHHC
jgi:hypothetical protein